jgi:hypothetical protein
VAAAGPVTYKTISGGLHSSALMRCNPKDTGGIYGSVAEPAGSKCQPPCIGTEKATER